MHVPREIRPILNTIAAVETLPAQNDVLDVLRFMNAYHGSAEERYWQRFCAVRNIHNIPNPESVDALAEAMHAATADRPIVEIWAGTGKLAYHLRQRGIPITATDKTGNDYVEPISYEDVLEFYQDVLEFYPPRFVLGSWIPFSPHREGPYVHLAVFTSPSVRYFFDINAHPAASYDMSVYDDILGRACYNHGWTRRRLYDVEALTTSRRDAPGTQYSAVTLYERNDPAI